MDRGGGRRYSCDTESLGRTGGTQNCDLDGSHRNGDSIWRVLTEVDTGLGFFFFFLKLRQNWEGFEEEWRQNWKGFEEKWRQNWEGFEEK